ncbi:MAG TPA: hypothetical protein VIC71_11095 [Gammaproteobacteria bacterium]|jgi:hypothetical protein
MSFREGQEVRIRTLHEPRHWERHRARSARSPIVGDLGLVVDVDASGGTVIYTVESTDINGSERWLTEFLEEELEPIPPARPTPAR